MMFMTAGWVWVKRLVRMMVPSCQAVSGVNVGRLRACSSFLRVPKSVLGSVDMVCCIMIEDG